ncbi:MAG TPA: thioredoxin [Mariniphaga anaerophila]|uniref:Thioredoxin n=1 Tax=Mariniphaga anaerophila TaxID=1484053 RepID=A0A831LQH2_9BACT|nr:thioredoxin [Mariniphaga anaerophila]
MKMLQTAVHEIETATELEKIISENENVMVSCGRMGPMCVPVYDVMEELEEERPEIKFYTMGFDTPEAAPIRNAPLCRGFMGLPFNVYYKNGQMVHATTSIQNRQQIIDILDNYLA